MGATKGHKQDRKNTNAFVFSVSWCPLCLLVFFVVPLFPCALTINAPRCYGPSTQQTRKPAAMDAKDSAVTIPQLQQMKRDGKKIVGVVAWDYQIARIIDRAGVEIISVGDTVGINLWGHATPLEVTMEEMIVVCKAVRRGTKRALVSCDFPFGPLQEGTDSAVRAAIRLVKEAGADMVKLDGAADFPDAVRAISRAGIPVFAQFGLTPQTALALGMQYNAMNKPGAELAADMAAKMVEEAKRLEEAGAALLDFTNSGAVAGE